MKHLARNPAEACTRINLLRHYTAQQRQLKYLPRHPGLWVLLLLVSAILMSRLALSTLTEPLARDNQQLTVSIQALQAKLPEHLPASLSSQDSQYLRLWLAERQQLLQLFDDLIRLTPAQIALSSLEQLPSGYIITGYASQPTTLSQLEQELARSPHWKKIQRLDASATVFDQQALLGFKLSLSQAHASRLQTLPPDLADEN